MCISYLQYAQWRRLSQAEKAERKTFTYLEMIAFVSRTIEKRVLQLISNFVAGSTLTPWSAWGQCTVTCGTGERTRSRGCSSIPANNCDFKQKEVAACVGPPCPSEYHIF